MFHPSRGSGSMIAGSPSRPNTICPEDEEEFRLAMEAYRQQSGRMFPTWTEVLEVLHAVGYAKRVWRPVSTHTAGAEFKPAARS